MNALTRLDRIRRVHEDATRMAVTAGGLLMLLSLGGDPWMSRVMAPFVASIVFVLILRDFVKWKRPPGEMGVVAGIGIFANLALFGLLVYAAVPVKAMTGIFGLLAVVIAPFLGLGLGMRVNEKRIPIDPEESIAETRLIARVIVILAIASLAVGIEPALWLGFVGVLIAIGVLTYALYHVYRAYEPLRMARVRDGKASPPYATREAETLLAGSFLLAAVALKAYLKPYSFVFPAGGFIVILGALDVIQLVLYMRERRKLDQPAPTPMPKPEPEPEPAPLPPPPPEPPPQPEPVEEPAPRPAPAAPSAPAVSAAPRATLHANDGTEPDMTEPRAILAEVLWRAIDREASEVMFHRDGDAVHVRYVQDGVPEPGELLNTSEFEPIRASIIELAGEERRFGAEGSRGFVAVNVAHDRGSTMLKIVRPLPELLGLDGLGMTKEIAEMWRGHVRAPGFYLICAPPESGKTTTLYASLMEIDREKKRVVSLERRVERELPGVKHIEVPVSDSLSDAIRNQVERPVDVLALPDLDEPDAVREAVSFATKRNRTVIGATWASVFGLSSLAKLVDLGVEKIRIGEIVKGILAQRLARRLCPACRQVAEPDRGILLDLELKSAPSPYYVAAGCEACGMSGYRGRIGLFELVTLRPFAAAKILEEISFKVIEGILREGKFKPLREDGIARAVEGVTSCEEVARTLGQR